MFSLKSFWFSYTLFFKKLDCVGKEKGESKAQGRLLWGKQRNNHIYQPRGKCQNWGRAWNREERGWWVDQGLRSRRFWWGMGVWAGFREWCPEARRKGWCKISCQMASTCSVKQSPHCWMKVRKGAVMNAEGLDELQVGWRGCWPLTYRTAEHV